MKNYYCFLIYNRTFTFFVAKIINVYIWVDTLAVKYFLFRRFICNSLLSPMNYTIIIIIYLKNCDINVCENYQCIKRNCIIRFLLFSLRANSQWKRYVFRIKILLKYFILHYVHLLHIIIYNGTYFPSTVTRSIHIIGHKKCIIFPYI